MSTAPAQNKSQPLKYTVTHHRKPEHTHEEFIKWIVEEHIPLAVPLFKKYGVTRYSLVSIYFSSRQNVTILRYHSSSHRLLPTIK